MMRRYFFIYFSSFIIFLLIGFLFVRIFHLEQRLGLHRPPVEEVQPQPSAYEEIDMILPVQAFLKRGANSSNLSVVKRLFVNQWISANQNDLIKLVMYAQGATSFPELQKAFQDGLRAEGTGNGAYNFVVSALETIQKDPKLVEHVNESLVEGFSPSIHMLRGKMMEVDPRSKEYKKLRSQYKKALDEWMHERHGHLLDEMAAQF